MTGHHTEPSRGSARRRSGGRRNGGSGRGVRGLVIAWANVRKSLSPHISLLARCWGEKIDVVHVQEPWTGKGTRTQNHPGYESYAPLDAWDGEDERPRVISYVRKGKRLQAQQRRPIRSRDMLWLDVNGHPMLNVYRE
ncbi:hypothetical protein EV127DRAFT_355392, partial [Xylaria flabelliformis]